MHEYDTALKTFLRHGRASLLALAGIEVSRWHNVELPAVRNSRVDLLGESADGRLIHIELQSTNHAAMALRMLEYFTWLYRSFDRFPEQVVLYVGEAPLRMTGTFTAPGLAFECRIVDIRDLDGERLLESDEIGDNIIAILARVRDRAEAVRKILKRIATAEPRQRADALEGFMILAGLRKLGETIRKEASRMPLLDDIMDHEVLGREFRRGLERGELKLLLRLIERRFGSVSTSLRDKLALMTPSEIEAAGDRLLDARSPDELLP